MQTDNEILANLIASQGRVEGKLDTLVDTLKSDREENVDRHIHNEGKISGLEKRINMATGSVGFLMFIVAPVLGFLNYFKH